MNLAGQLGSIIFLILVQNNFVLDNVFKKKHKTTSFCKKKKKVDLVSYGFLTRLLGS
jgi:hypothetical protein